MKIAEGAIEFYLSTLWRYSPEVLLEAKQTIKRQQLQGSDALRPKSVIHSEIFKFEFTAMGEQKAGMTAAKRLPKVHSQQRLNKRRTEYKTSNNPLFNRSPSSTTTRNIAGGGAVSGRNADDHFQTCI